MCNLIPELKHTYHGFLLEQTEELEDIRSTGYLFRHTRSGARLFYLRNNDRNKVFSVAFKTPPQNSCGTPHILEHSVLCGSRKYAAKDPFNELAKGSLNTFLNAMTYADKTMYPVASCNEKDFHNLMDVYMDAVFFPRIYEKKEIFQQEGWRYVLKDASSPLEITGIVYNEMKGALSDPESLLNYAISRSIFGETTYGFEAGGDPAAIPELTYEDFLQFHQTYYHPSNSYFYLYGDMDWESCLEHIDSACLSAFRVSDKLPVISGTDCAKKGMLLKETYPAAEDGESSGSYFAYNLKAGCCTNPERIMALQILSYILLETNASPLKTALLDQGICEETDGWFDSSCYEMVFSIIAKNADLERIQIFSKVIEETLRCLAEEGISTGLMESALRKYEFLLLEEDFGSTPKGLIYCSRMMKSWLHGKEPFESLHPVKILERIKAESKKGYFEGLIRSVFLENEDWTILQFEPAKGKGRREAEALRKKLEQKKASMTNAEIAELIEENKRLDAFQTQEDPPELLEQIPQLSLSEISPEPMYTKYRLEKLAKGIPLLFTPLESGRILYMKLHFDTSVLPPALLPYSGLLAELLGKLDTESFSFQELPTAINQCFGELIVFNDIFNQSASQYRSFVTVKGKLLKEDLTQALQMVKEILLRTCFDKVESLKKIVKSAKIQQEDFLLNQSHSAGIFYCGSHLFKGMEIEDTVSGIRFYQFLCQIDKDLEQNPESVSAKLKETADLLFQKSAPEISLGCEETAFLAVKTELDIWVSHFSQQTNISIMQPFVNTPAKSAFSCAGGVAYNILAFDMKKQNFPYHGSYQVLRTIVNLEYLWNAIRVQGGAYGCGCQFQRNGFACFYSYRDPHLQNTYAVYRRLWQEIAHFRASEREMAKYILGTINRLDQPKTNMERFNAAINRHYRNISIEDFKQERTEILHTTVQDIRDCAAMLEMADVSENICTIGSDQIIWENTGFFTEIKPLI